MANLQSPYLRKVLRHMPLLLFFVLLQQGFILLDCYLKETPLATRFLHPKHIIWSFEILIIPQMAITVIYWATSSLLPSRSVGWKPILLKFIGTCIGVIIGTGIMEWTYRHYGIIEDDRIVFGAWSLSPLYSTFLTNIVIGSAVGIPLFFRQSNRQKLHNQLENKQLEVGRLEQMKTRAELLALQARINPHFLYNSLNSIAALIQPQPEKAEKMVVHLADLFRYSLNTQGALWTTVGEELDMMMTFLEVERVRFGDQLELTVTCPEELRPIALPRFLLQPMVENALKHGISKMEKGILKVGIEKIDQSLLIQIADNGHPFPAQQINGYGWQSTHDKLQLLYEGKQAVFLLNEPEKMVRISVPLHKTEHHDAVQNFDY